ncbi:MAG: 2,3,4,5-tetrahydropyridine-2,6-dicarboxylate N-acetyltransferase [Parabacteroides distasonis]|uniref:acyltransferase n=1 Tax=Parabacteroides sp. TaxID=1869337 RepID=UPI00257F3133|nr:acyltransferase [Parabacteroides sp.]
MNKAQFSRTYRFLRLIGLNYSEKEYGQVSLWQVIKRILKTYKDAFLLKFGMESWLLSPLLPRKIRPAILRSIGCHIGVDVFVGDHVKIDSGHADLIVLEDHVHIAGGCRLLCHQRDLSNYCVGDDYAKLGYRLATIHLKKGCLIGMESIVLPGVTVGEGAIVGAGSLVTKNIPDWTIATGRPAKVIKQIPIRNR